MIKITINPRKHVNGTISFSQRIKDWSGFNSKVGSGTGEVRNNSEISISGKNYSTSYESRAHANYDNEIWIAHIVRLYCGNDQIFAAGKEFISGTDYSIMELEMQKLIDRESKIQLSKHCFCCGKLKK